PWGVRSRARNEARSLRRSASRLLRRNRGKIPEAGAAEVETAMAGVDEALAQPQGMRAVNARHALDAVLDKHLAFARKGAVREYTESIGGAILVALLLRAFFFEPFHIPSGSMIPTLLVGDFIFVNKMSYGLRVPFTDPSKVHKIWESAPLRGDVVVFINPQHPDIDYVKRVIGLPGDRIEVRDNVLFVDGAVALIGWIVTYGPAYWDNTDVKRSLQEAANLCYRQTDDEKVKDFVFNELHRLFDTEERGPDGMPAMSIDVQRDDLRIER